jgi:hypothetical protein
MRRYSSKTVNSRSGLVIEALRIQRERSREALMKKLANEPSVSADSSTKSSSAHRGLHGTCRLPTTAHTSERLFPQVRGGVSNPLGSTGSDSHRHLLARVVATAAIVARSHVHAAFGGLPAEVAAVLVALRDLTTTHLVGTFLHCPPLSARLDVPFPFEGVRNAGVSGEAEGPPAAPPTYGR